jgi:Putative papain-like cysteine peptidase (DUF1796)
LKIERKKNAMILLAIFFLALVAIAIIMIVNSSQTPIKQQDFKFAIKQEVKNINDIQDFKFAIKQEEMNINDIQDLNFDAQEKFDTISLGIRCSSALILNVSKLRNAAGPFDWAQIHVDDMLDILDLPNDEVIVENYYKNLTNDLDDLKQHKITKSWFPHDTFPNDIAKYVRRTLRMNKMIRNSTNQLIFLTTFGVLLPDHKEKFLKLKNKVQNYLKTLQFLFFCSSATTEDQYLHEEHIYYLKDTVTLGTEKNHWDIYEATIASKIKNILYFRVQDSHTQGK